MRLALSGTEVSEHEGLDPLLACCYQNGVQSIDLWYPRNTAVPGLEAAIQQLEEQNISVASIGTATELASNCDPSVAQTTIIQAVELAARVGCGMVNTYFGWPAVRDDAAAIETYVRRVQPCLSAAREHGVILTIENEFDSFAVDPLGTDITRRPESLRTLIEAVGSPYFRATFDPCNALFAGVDPEEMYREIAPYVVSIHVKDGMTLPDPRDVKPWKSYSDSATTYATCPLGHGQVEWERLLPTAADDGYRGYLIIEPHSEPSARSLAWSQAVDYLRSIPAADL